MKQLVVVGVLFACGSNPSPSPTPAPSPAATAADAGPPPDAATPGAGPGAGAVRALWTPRIDNEAQFLDFSKELGNERFGKFVIDVKTDAVYYFDVDVYPVHKDFIFKALYKTERTPAANKVFDKNYGPVKPDFLMIYLVHHLSQDLWTFAFWDGDLATAEHVRRAYKRMKETFYLGDRVKFRPDSPHQERVAKEAAQGADPVPYILNDQIYQASPYVAFNPGVAIGKLRHVPENVPEADLTFDPSEIVILHSTLSDITPVAGIISETFSTPLAHVSLRARGWGIPNIGLKEADAKLKALVGKVVYFEARGSDYTVREATPEELAAREAKQQAARHVNVPVADRETAELRSLEAMRATDLVTYGAKAANLGEIVHAHDAKIRVPAGFGVPFKFYFDHLAANGLDKQIAAMLADPAFQRDPAVRKARLAKLRAAIVAAPVSAELRAAVEAALPTIAPDPETGVFCRSSGNVEDLPDFNGAGVYDTVPNLKGVDHVLGGIAQVWASIWNLGAYENRHLYNIDEATVASGVLVQVGVAATAAGVLVTAHPTDPSDEKTYTINAKSGLGMAVVDGRAVPESLIVSWYNHGIRVLSRSTEATKLVFDEHGGIHEVPNTERGKPVLTNGMAIQLADTAHRLTKIFQSTKLDIEWVFEGKELFIVQTRPYVAGSAH